VQEVKETSLSNDEIKKETKRNMSKLNPSEKLNPKPKNKRGKLSNLNP
jgi:hypothetical protein